ncbi:1,4-dihydroxy-2-naphthoate prenyltransferase [Labedella populi]|uniref:1,4-dihydroxy-2-naphthoate prenyltransferase n=1 Tax=Labedella populi TaxID=2498850 RepID=A0A444Q687_9MICO|nr:UbiA family prenyltransferase [Labedella populi]RWZ59360.1 1,4-dihydroxy-2-naphthoate prenyltransferase [Labedella populi]
MRTLRLLLLSSHPGPTAAVTVLCVVLGLAITLEPWRLLVLGAAVLAGQLSIGFSNDAIDATRDAEVGRVDKPIARGEISRRTVAVAAAIALVLALALSAVLGVGMLVAHTVVIAGGWVYNAWLKRTAFSVLPFVVSFGTVPSLATLSASEPAGAAAWASATGAILGVSIHFTNALPDLIDDRRTGVRGLPHRLGRRVAGALAFTALALGAVVVLVGPTLLSGASPGRPPGVVEVVGFAATLLIALVGLVLAVGRPAHRLLFRLVMAAGLLIAIQLALGGVRLVA